MRWSEILARLPSRQVWPWLVSSFLLLAVATNYTTFRLSQDTYRYLFVVDITQSMNVSDLELESIAITRLEFAKSVVEAAFLSLPCGSEAGLAIFSEHRTFVLFTPVEVCEHYRTMSDMLKQVNWRMAWAARSEIAKGLYSAIDAARHSELDTRLVFLTDGHEAPPVHKDIRPPFNAEPGSVTGIIGGIGGPLPNRIPHIDDNENIVGYWSRDEVMQIDVHSMGRAATQQGETMAGINMVDVARRIALGQEHLSSLRENYLQELATQTGLDYVRVESPSEFTASLRLKAYAGRRVVQTDLGWIPAILAFFCLTYCFVLLPRAVVRRRPRPHARNG
ncbi:MAG: VWA domain-containing protein [Gammaproteobacteria bacterium]|nr:VWA domain-containing protein [Gammaproteobacteria bacterium]